MQGTPDEVNIWLQAIGSEADPEGTMEKLAEELIDQYHREHPRSKLPPKAEKLAPIRKIRLDREREARTSGSLQIASSGFVLRVKPVGNVNRRNFTIAHEIGHTFFFDIDRSPPVALIPPSKLSSPLIEKLCNFFAASLLLPRFALEMFTDELNSNQAGNETLERIAKRFTVSPETLVRRIKHLSLMKNPYLLILLAKQFRPEEEPVIEVVGNRHPQTELYCSPLDLSISGVAPGHSREVIFQVEKHGHSVIANADLKVYASGMGGYAIAFLNLSEEDLLGPGSDVYESR